MGMSCSPEILPKIVLAVAGVCYEQREDACSTDLDGGDYDQDDASYQARLRAHLAPFSLLSFFLRGHLLEQIYGQDDQHRHKEQAREPLDRDRVLSPVEVEDVDKR